MVASVVVRLGVVDRREAIRSAQRISKNVTAISHVHLPVTWVKCDIVHGGLSSCVRPTDRSETNTSPRHTRAPRSTAHVHPPCSLKKKKSAAPPLCANQTRRQLCSLGC